MGLSALHILHQSPTLSAITRTALAAARHAVRPRRALPPLPSSTLTQTLHPRPPSLIRDYIQHTSHKPSLYSDHLPPHFFPQWAFGLAARTLSQLPYNPTQIVNGGCKLSIHHPIPHRVPLVSSAQLVSVDDNGRRAVLHQTITTGTRQHPDALQVDLYPIVRRVPSPERSSLPDTLSMPSGATRIHTFSFAEHHARSFALLTGDINPIHWFPPYARAAGFPNTILHGFATLAHTFEALLLQLFDAPSQIAHIDVRFKRPLALPTEAHLYIAPHATLPQRTLLYLTDNPARRPFLTGHVDTHTTPPQLHTTTHQTPTRDHP